jgi:hypothetical protein
MITLIFAMVGLLDDISSLASDGSHRIPQWIRFLVQVSYSFPKCQCENMSSFPITLN